MKEWTLVLLMTLKIKCLTDFSEKFATGEGKLISLLSKLTNNMWNLKEEGIHIIPATTCFKFVLLCVMYDEGESLQKRNRHLILNLYNWEE